MSREAALTVMIIVALFLIAGVVWAWRRRTRRDAAIVAPVGEAPSGAAVLGVHEVLYVATTRHGDALERLAIKGLAFRSRADLTVTAAGIALDLTGQPRIFLPTTRIAQVAQATVTIDRVVERDGLVRLSWRTDDDAIVDSYLRPQNSSARALADAIGGILTPSQIGTDA